VEEEKETASKRSMKEKKKPRFRTPQEKRKKMSLSAGGGKINRNTGKG